MKFQFQSIYIKKLNYAKNFMKIPKNIWISVKNFVTLQDNGVKTFERIK